MLFLRMNFVLVLIGTVGSLLLSEVFLYPPCSLCWYQRICLYPLAIIFGVALWNGDDSYHVYASPFTAIGIVISGYHNLLYYGIVPSELKICSADMSCTAQQLELFGFLTIPLMSLFAFTVSGILIWLDRRSRYAK